MDLQGEGDTVIPTKLHHRKHYKMDFLRNEDAGQGGGGKEHSIPPPAQLKWQHTC